MAIPLRRCFRPESPCQHSMKKRPFILDCDTGTDDAIAIVAALGCEEMELVGITCVNGNVPEEDVARNNRNLLAYLGRNIPVCRGAWLPFSANRRTGAGAGVHGSTGLGTVELPEAKSCPFEERIAAQFIYEEAKKRNGELELLVTGPMTNIAIAIIEHPDFCDYIRHLYFMGGAAAGGNVNNTEEFNIWVDPEAVHIVLSSPIPCTMVGLDVTNLAIMTREDEERIRSLNTKEAVFVADLIRYMSSREKILLARMHDPLALASALFPECLETKTCFVDTECRGTYTRGHTAADLRNRRNREPNTEVAVKVNVELFKDWLIEKIACAGRKGGQG